MKQSASICILHELGCIVLVLLQGGDGDDQELK
jgi:hypothetical protein